MLFLFLNLDKVPRKTTPGRFLYIWQSKWVGIIAINTERTQIHFLSDVLFAVASLNLKVPSTLPIYRQRLLKALVAHFYPNFPW